jgi:hypothetical protein
VLTTWPWCSVNVFVAIKKKFISWTSRIYTPLTMKISIQHNVRTKTKESWQFVKDTDTGNGHNNEVSRECNILFQS